MLIAIDTSAGTGVAIADDAGRVIAERSSADTRRHAEVIGDFIRECLTEARLTPRELTAVVAGMGPGPFTGLRVGIAAARTFALGVGLPVIPIVSHDAIAFGASAPVIVSTDARRREVYWSRYAGSDSDGLPIRTAGPGLVKADHLESVVDIENHRLIEAHEIPVGAAASLAACMVRVGRSPDDAFEGDPHALYLRSPDVTISAGPKRVTS